MLLASRATVKSLGKNLKEQGLEIDLHTSIHNSNHNYSMIFLITSIRTIHQIPSSAKPEERLQIFNIVQSF